MREVLNTLKYMAKERFSYMQCREVTGANLRAYLKKRGYEVDGDFVMGYSLIID
jgi:hypothetical protein